MTRREGRQPGEPCPVAVDVKEVTDLSQDLVRSLRRLRRDLLRCQGCERQATCPILAQFRAQVDGAIQSVAEAWNLAGLYGF